MPAAIDPLSRVVLIAAGACLVMTAVLVASVTSTESVVIWKVGSPHTGNTPTRVLPSRLQRDAVHRGVHLVVETFPANGLAARLHDAMTRNAAPDILVFDNLGLVKGITTQLGRFEGIAEDARIGRDLVAVTGALDELLGPQRGWTYLIASSPHHHQARTLALRSPTCPNGSARAILPTNLAQLVPRLVTGYLDPNAVPLEAHADPDRLSAARPDREKSSVVEVHPCAFWGNDKLAFVSVIASYAGETAIGHMPILLALRKLAAEWHLLVVTRDPISTSRFVKELPAIAGRFTSDRSSALPAPATLLFPADGGTPLPPGGQRFGSFTWRSSPSDEVVAEIAEFVYPGDVRLFITRRSASATRISAGLLWTTHSPWHWRVWSISRSGDVALSETRSFLESQR